MSARNQHNGLTLDSLDPVSYRAVMRHKADSVCIVAAGRTGTRGGLTATSVCSLSDDPPTILVCINQTASLHDLIVKAGGFSVNLLAGDQKELANIFSGKTGVRGNDRFKDAHWQETSEGIPILKGALATLECALSDCHEFATHSIFLGRVTGASARSDAEPLLYSHGQYRELG